MFLFQKSTQAGAVPAGVLPQRGDPRRPVRLSDYTLTLQQTQPRAIRTASEERQTVESAFGGKTLSGLHTERASEPSSPDGLFSFGAWDMNRVAASVVLQCSTVDKVRLN
ncbi:hypothetical protein SKAU_G00350150 [Synaphobranchus kaupii]|uniref:Uncharacterized protein n=1 Tax=Synaphobranchus kaupii TaxID=118154 RepID=A0A9Q1IHU8_SYNKA|nr:hypothetical protein SKAU_G00350150 [Synaphobranchus kaupii]